MKIGLNMRLVVTQWRATLAPLLLLHGFIFATWEMIAAAEASEGGLASAFEWFNQKSNTKPSALFEIEYLLWNLHRCLLVSYCIHGIWNGD